MRSSGRRIPQAIQGDLYPEAEGSIDARARVARGAGVVVVLWARARSAALSRWNMGGFLVPHHSRDLAVALSFALLAVALMMIVLLMRY